MDVAFASWLDQCPDKVRFILQYNDLRSDIASDQLLDSSIEVEKEVITKYLTNLSIR